MALDPNGKLYLATLAQGITNPPKVISYDPVTNGVRWTYSLPIGAANDALMTPLVDSAGGRLFIANDLGHVISLRLSDGAELWKSACFETQFRSQLAYDEARKRIYVHANNGRLYAFSGMPTNVVSNPNSLVTWTSCVTSNQGPPAVGPHHTRPMSSGPVIGRDGRVYVGSSDGHVYGFHPDTLALVLHVNVGQSIEAPLALGNRGDLFVATRTTLDERGAQLPANLVRIDLATGAETGRWPVTNEGETLGCIAAPLVDRHGYAYAADFGHYVIQVDLTSGEQVRTFRSPGKLCQTPALTHDQLLWVVSSAPTAGANQYFARHVAGFPIYAPPVNGPFSPIEPAFTNNYSLPAITSAVNVLGGLSVAADGRLWFADDTGRLYRLTRSSPLMGGGWVNWTDQYGQPLGPWSSALWDGTTIRSATGYYTYDLPANVYGMNEAYDLAGVYENRAVIWPAAYPGPTWPTYLPQPAPFTASAATDINDAGLMVGHASAGGIGPVAMQWSFNEGINPPAWEYRVLGATNSQSWAYGVTEAGWTLGKFKTNNVVEGFLLPQGAPSLSQAKRTGTAGATSSEVWAALDGLGFCGHAIFPSNKRRAFLVVTNLSAFGAGGLLTNHFLPAIAGVTNANHRSAAFGLNAGCVTVGWATLNNNAQRAALWLPGATNAIDLNTRRQPGFTRLLVSAAAVTDGGIIVGQCPDAEGASIGWIAYPVYKKH